ncbi:arylsulfatase [Albibacillus kandeliae]|uniref:arylsulfatase n=1 Tax=Albibacillus kandeliae TaxID=2174228 RepID=UPI000D69C664|nr:arylsulfatase [Albibacillus kandeliae]
MRPPSKSNIILILADDMGFSDLGCMGSEIRTPNIDRLAAGGQTYTAMYNCARCCPTRASLLTGLYPHKAGIGHMTASYGSEAYQGYLRNDAVTIAEVLRLAGYRTLMSGKWHVGGSYKPRESDLWLPGDVTHPTPRQRGFDRFFGTLDGSGSYFFPHYIGEDDHRVDIEQDDFYMTDAITEKAVEMIGDAVSDHKPFFLYLAYTAPHWPLQAHEEDIARYRGQYRKGWDHLRTSRHEEMLSRGMLEGRWDISPRDPEAHPWIDEKHQDWEDSRMATYAAMVDSMDQGIGRVMRKLRDLGVEKNTLVLFLSDNGGCAEFLAEEGWVNSYPDSSPRGEEIVQGNIPDLTPGPGTTFQSYETAWSNVSNAPFRMHKTWVHEGGISTPLVAYWPEGIASPGIVHDARHVSDIMPTILDVTGASYPKDFGGVGVQNLDGESLIDTFRNIYRQREQPIYWEHEGNCAMRDGDWKLVREFGQDWELYNMRVDRTELNDLRHKDPTRAEGMIKAYEDWANKVGVVDWAIVQAHPDMDWVKPEKPVG